MMAAIGTSETETRRAIVLGLVAVTCAVFARLMSFDFIIFDDHEYVVGNEHIRTGLCWANIAWAFCTGEEYWIPLTRLTRMAICQFFGLQAGAHHAVNVALHIANVVLLFLLLLRMTGERWRSAMVAALFAWHPLHVESVAWVTELKDVLSALFWVLATGAYVSYTRLRKRRDYWLTMALFCAGLMAKPMLVTFPVTLLLLDYWPLRRSAGTPWRTLVMEKAPMMLVACLCAAVTFAMTQWSKGPEPFDNIAWQLSLGNGLQAAAQYLQKTVWPAGLSFFYALEPDRVTWTKSLGAGLFLFLLSAVVFWRRAKSPHLMVGWLWYVITILPTLRQVRFMAMADRYTYIPLIGIFLAIVWEVAYLWSRRQYSSKYLKGIALACLILLAGVSWARAAHWRDTETLSRDALGVNPGNWVAHLVLADTLAQRGDLQVAIDHYRQASAQQPKSMKAQYNLAAALCRKGDIPGAIEHFREALALNPGYAQTHHSLGLMFMRTDRMDMAATHFSEAVKLRPDDAQAHNDWGNVLLSQGKLQDAMSHYIEALKINDDFAEAHYNMGNVLLRWGRDDEALRHFMRAAALAPDDPDARKHIRTLLARQASGGAHASAQ